MDKTGQQGIFGFFEKGSSLSFTDYQSIFLIPRLIHVLYGNRQDLVRQRYFKTLPVNECMTFGPDTTKTISFKYPPTD